jgi:glycosyltransferase involved in cell wall biosynthesis
MSLLEQTVPPYEIIVCDDGSTDELDDALEPFLDAIVLIRQENQGPSSARNRAVERATGEFVVFLDADDRFDPMRLERLGVLALDRPDLDILTTDALVEVDGVVIGRFYTSTNRFVVDDQRVGILTTNFIFGLLAVRRTALVRVGGFDEGLRQAEDWDCWMRLILEGARAGLVDEPLAVYRVRSGSGSSDRIRLLHGRVGALERVLKRTDLTDKERRVAVDARSFASRMLAVAEAQQALLNGSPDARALSLHIVVGRGFFLSSRAKAILGVVAPGAAAGRLARRRTRMLNDPKGFLAERE